MPFKIVSEIALPVQLFDPTSVLRSLLSCADKKVGGIGRSIAFPDQPFMTRVFLPLQSTAAGS